MLPILGIANNRTVEVEFYSENLTITYPSEIILPGLLILEDISLMDYYEKMDQTPWQELLDHLNDYKKKYRLNDWFYFELLKTVVDQIYSTHGPLKQEVSLWFLLTKSGFDTRLSYLNDDVFIYVWSEEDIFETPMILDQDKRFINLSCINDAKSSPEQLKLLLYRPGSKGLPFSFKLKQFPLLKPQIKEREIFFNMEDQSYRMELKIDATIFELMKSYPAIAEKEYFDIPMSDVAYRSLIPKLKHMVKEKSIVESLRMIASFTRSGFKYKDDKEVFGKSKPMIAEELFHYQYSDCEDRSALFYYLVKELLDLPMLIIAYPDHLTIAVASDHLEGVPFLYNDQKYFICDPTGPSESNIIGIPPTGYENTPFEIIGQYR